MNSTTLALLAAAALVTGAVALSMLRRPVLGRIGLRNFGRRKWNTALVVLGSMVGTALISGSLVLNDSTTRFQENEARDTLGEIDEVVQQTSQRLPSDRRPIPNFNAAEVRNITPESIRRSSRDAEKGPAGADGILGVLTQEVPAEALREDGRERGRPELQSPAVTVLGVDWKDLGRFGEERPEPAARPAPGFGEVYISKSLSSALGLEAGGRIRLRGVEGFREFRIVGVLQETGISGYKARFSSSDGTVLVSSRAARSLFGAGDGEINTLFVSNEGDVVSGVEASGPVAEALRDLLEDSGTAFEVSQVKKDTIEQGGFQIGDIFLMISSFAILAGVLLIINIYTMLAEERKGELGILRALALKRADLVRVFVYEGFAYSLLASLLGVLVGLGIAAILVRSLNRAAEVFTGLFNDNLTIPFHAEPVSLLISLAAGLLITFLAVFFTSLRISNLNIVSAIRDLPEERPERLPLGRVLLQSLLFAAGLGVSAAGFSPGDFGVPITETQRGYLMLIGPVLAVTGLGFLLSRALSARLSWTVLGSGILAYSYFANGFEEVSKANETSPAMFFVEGVFMVLAAVVVVTFNVGILYGALGLLMRLVPRLAPVLKVAVAYPASRRARTGFTLAMFSLVLYVVTVSSVFSSTQNAASQRNRDEQLSGYDGFVQAGPLARVESFDEKVANNRVLDENITDSVELSAVGVVLPKYRAEDYKTEFGPPTGDAPPGAGLSEYLTYAPEGFLETTTDRLAVRAPRYESDREAWRALAKNPDLVMLTFPYNGKGEFQSRPRLGPKDTIVLQNPLTGERLEKRVAGRIREPSGFSLGVVNGVIASERARGEFSNLRPQATYLFNLKPDPDLAAVGRELDNEFAATGAQSFLVDDILGRGQAFIDTFVKIVQAFLAFGLVVGIAGLAVISARAVHERHRDIGTLRAVGFGRATVGWQFVVESSFVALLGIVIGISVGALGGYNLFTFAIDDAGAVFIFPWSQMLLIGTGVWAASLLSTIVPAVRASRVPPVEALRYQG